MWYNIVPNVVLNCVGCDASCIDQVAHDWIKYGLHDSTRGGMGAKYVLWLQTRKRKRNFHCDASFYLQPRLERGGGVNSPIPELLATLAVLPGGRSYCYSKFMAFGTRGGQLTWIVHSVRRVLVIFPRIHRTTPCGNHLLYPVRGDRSRYTHTRTFRRQEYVREGRRGKLKLIIKTGVDCTLSG